MKNILVAFFQQKDHTFDDISSEKFYKNKLKMSLIMIFIMTMSFLISSLIMYLYFSNKLTSSKANDILNIFMLTTFCIIIVFSPYHPRCFGFNLNKLKFNLLTAIPIGLMGAGLAVLFRYQLFIKGDVFQGYFFSINSILYRLLIYPLISICQEVVTKGYLQSFFIALLNKMKGSKFLAIFFSSLLFALMHLVIGIPVFIAVFLYSFLTGWYYEKTRSLIGVSIIHYISGLGLYLFSGFDLYLK